MTKTLTISVTLILGACALLGSLGWFNYFRSVDATVVQDSRPSNGANMINRALRSSDNAQFVGLGSELYATHCAACHGINLEGQPDWQTPNADGSLKAPPHDDSGHTWHHDDKTLYQYTKLGGKTLMAQAGVENFPSGMPGFGDKLTDAEIDHIFVFIKSRWTKRNQKIQRERTEAAANR